MDQGTGNTFEGIVRPSCRITVESLGELSSSPAVCFETHPVHPWVLYVTNINSNSTVISYDYSQKRVMMRKSLKDIIISHDKLIPIPSTPTVHFVPDASQRIGGGLSEYAVNSTLKSNPVAKNVTSSNSLSYGIIKSVHYADLSSLQLKWHGKRKTRVHFSSFHSESLLIIICESAIIFHDYHSDTNKILTNSDLEKSNPLCVEFVHHHVIAIGCNDGVVRLWDCINWILIKSLLAHSKESKTNEICCLKSLPDNKENDQRDPLIRFISLSRDSVGYIWIGTVNAVQGSATIVDIVDPVAIIENPQKDTLFTGSSSFPVAQYYDNVASTLYTVSSNHKTRVWDLSPLPSFMSSRRSSSKSAHVSPQVTPSKLKPTIRPRRSSKLGVGLAAFNIFKSKSDATESIIQVPCLYVIKPGRNLGIGKVSGCALIKNSFLYPSEYGMLYINRSDSLYLAVMHTANPKQQSGISDRSIGVVMEDKDSALCETASNHSESSVDAMIGAQIKDLLLTDTIHVYNPKVNASLIMSMDY
jgi:hypothetical protein